MYLRTKIAKLHYEGAGITYFLHHEGAILVLLLKIYLRFSCLRVLKLPLYIVQFPVFDKL